MRGLIRLVGGCAVALAATFLTFPGPAAALSCPDPVTMLDKTDVVVRGRVLPEPFPGVVLLWVNGYHKGAGARLLVAEVTTGHWSNKPRAGQDLMIGFHQEGFRLVNGPCSSFWVMNAGQPVPRDWLEPLGPAAKPGFGVTVRSALFLWQAPVLTVVGLLLWRGWRRHRTRVNRPDPGRI